MKISLGSSDDLPYLRRQHRTLGPQYKAPCRLRRLRLHIIRGGGGFFRLEDDQKERRDGDKRPGVVFSTVGATVAILSPYVELKSDSRPLIFPRMLSSKATPGRLSSPACFMAGAYGNRTHQEPVSRPLTGFEDRPEHQLLTRSRMRQDTSEDDANRRNPLFHRMKRPCTVQHPILPSRQNPTHSVSIRPLRASPALPPCDTQMSRNPFRWGPGWSVRTGGRAGSSRAGRPARGA